MRRKRKEPYAGADFYRVVMNLVSAGAYIPRSVKTAYKRRAAYLNKQAKRRGEKQRMSAQKLMSAVLIRNRPK